jgi:hypothetical protein
MKRESSRLPLAIVIGCALLPVMAATYAGGYFLLPDSKGLYPAKWQYDMYQPVIKIQSKITKRPVTSGYIDPMGRRFMLVWHPHS